MKNKTLIGALAIAFVFTMFGVSYAATEWLDDNTFTGIVNWFPNGVKIGQQGTGGVTFFNGTIVNKTTTDAGADIPVTFGDNVRIDGELWRGEDSGPGDMPVKVNDDLLVYGNLELRDNVSQTNDFDGVVKAGVRYNATADAIANSFGVTSLTRLGAGIYTVVFEESMTNRFL